MNEEDFCFAFKCEYLRYCQQDLPTLTGIFETIDGPVWAPHPAVIWGAIAEYGDPPPGGLLVEIWGESNEAKGETATFRFWHARTNPNGKIVKGKAVMREELTGAATARAT